MFCFFVSASSPDTRLYHVEQCPVKQISNITPLSPLSFLFQVAERSYAIQRAGYVVGCLTENEQETLCFLCNIVLGVNAA